MKQAWKYLIVLALCPLVASAGQVTGLTTFVSGTPALASEVNGNFTAVSTAVNENDSRILALEADGAVSVSVFGFIEFFGNLNENSGCQLARLSNYAFFYAANRSCTAIANLSLPDGVTLQTVSCLVDDSVSDGGDPQIYPLSLRRQNLQTGAIDTINETIPGSTSTGMQTLSGGITPSSALVDNGQYSYALSLQIGTPDPVSGLEPLKFYGCSVGYSR